MMNVAAAQIGKNAEVIGVLKEILRYLGTTLKRASEQLDACETLIGG